MLRIILERLKTMVEVECACSIVNRVHFDRVYAKISGESLATCQGVEQQERPQSPSLDTSINGKSSQVNNGDRMARQSFPLRFRKHTQVECPC